MSDAKNQPHPDWVEDCQRWWGKLLTGTHRHWCPDWDYLPIDNTCPEFEACTCKWEESKT